MASSDASGAQAKPRCGARKSQGGQLTGKLCQQPAGFGTDHPGYGQCKFHGGATANGRKAAAEQLAGEIVERRRGEVGLFGDRAVVQPHDVLLDELRRSYALVGNIERSMGAWMAEGVPSEGTGAVVDGEHVVASGISEEQQGAGLPQLIAVHTTDKAVGFTDTEWAAWMKIYREERQHLVKVAQACAALGVLERHQRMLEANARFMRQVLERGLEALGVQAEPERIAAVMQDSIRYVVRETAEMANR